MSLKVIILSLFVFFILGCSNTTTEVTSPTHNQQQNVTSIFSNSVTEFKVHVFYESGASPYIGTIGLTANQTWDITKSSFTALFQNHTGRTITVPMTLSDMTSFPSQNKTSWTGLELIDLANSRSVPLKINSQINMNVFFVKGTFEGNNNILGVQFTGYPFAFIFKDVVTSTGGDGTTQRYVEQATVVHEIGHALGLVNNGLPMASNHEDASHSHHTSNTNCVMYWAVESKSNIISSITNLITGNQLNLFGSQSLSDGRNYHP